MATIGEIGINITASTAPLAKDLKKAQSQLTSFQTTIQSGASAFSGLGKQIAIVAGAAGIGAFLKSQWDAVDSLGAVAEKLGTTSSELQILRYAADQNSSSAEAMDSALGQLQTRLGDVGEEGNETTKALAQLGLTADEIKQQSPLQQMKTLADALAKVTNQFDRASIAKKLFGKGGLEVLPTLQRGGGVFDQAQANIQQGGFGLTDADVAKLKDAQDALDRLKKSTEGAAQQFLIGLAPAIDHVAQSMGALGGSGGIANTLGKSLASLQIIGERFFLVASAGPAKLAELFGDSTWMEELQAQAAKTDEAMDKIWNGGGAGSDKKKAADEAASKAAIEHADAVDKLIKKYNDEAAAIGKGGLSLSNLAAAQIKANEAERESIELAALAKQNREFENQQKETVLQIYDRLRQQIEAIGKSEEELAVAQAQNAGASPAWMERIEALTEELELKKKIQKQAEEQKRAEEQLAQQATQVWEQTRTPLEKYEQELHRLQEMLSKKLIDDETYARAEADLFKQQFQALKPPDFAQPASVQRGTQEAFAAIARHQQGPEQQNDAQLEKLEQLHRDFQAMIQQWRDLETAGEE